MKPISLKMKNFGPFQDETIDFTKLDSMFLITGKTGSGKSTIFDAISFALYGKAVGSRKNIKNEDLVSDFAKINEESFVDFKFSVKEQNVEKIYRIKRPLKYQYKKNDDSIGLKTQTSTLEYEEDGVWLNYKKTSTDKQRNEAIEKDIIKLGFEEFNKIIVLPQGEFANFLKQNSTDKSKTLKQVFPVEKIEELKENLKNQCDKIKNELDSTEKRIREIRKISDEKELKDKIAKLEDDIAVIETKNSEISEKIKIQTENKAKLQTNFENAQESENLKTEIKNLEEQKKEINEISQKIENSKNARIFLPEIEADEKANLTLKAAFENFEEAKTNLQNTKKNFESLQKEKISIDSLKEKTKTNERKLETLKNDLIKIEELENAIKNEKKFEENFLSFKEHIKSNEKELSQSKNEILEIAKGLNISESDENKILAAISKKFYEAQIESKNAEEILEKTKKITNETSKYTEIEEKLLEATKIEKEAKTNFDATKEILIDLEEKQKKFELTSKAETLAIHLKEGCECPVCGSLLHPKPAKTNGINLEEKITAQKKNLEITQKYYEESKENVLKLQSNFENQSRMLEELKKEFNFEFSIKDSINSFDEAQKIETELKELYEKVQKIVENIVEFSTIHSENEKKLSDLENDFKNAKTIVEERSKNLSENENSISISEKIQKIEDEINDDLKKIDIFEHDLKKSENEKIKSESDFENSKKNKTIAENESKQTSKKLSEKIKNSQFKSVYEIKSQIVDLETENTLQKKVSDWEKNLETKKALLKDKEQIESSEELLKKIEKIESSLSSFEIELSENSKIIKEKTVEFSENKSLLKELNKLDEKHQKIQKESGTIIKLFKDLNGENPAKIPFDTWILSIYFDEIIEFANLRLYELSNGRYQFLNEKTKNQGNHGLDLAIWDSHTNQIRNPVSLSGGETFQASISLALGLSDVVCQHSGKIGLDSLFIDEGFGSLDQDSLEIAMKTLQKIQENDRMVGIISHVESMKTEISSHIEIEKPQGYGFSKIKIV